MSHDDPIPALKRQLGEELARLVRFLARLDYRVEIAVSEARFAPRDRSRIRSE